MRKVSTGISAMLMFLVFLVDLRAQSTSVIKEYKKVFTTYPFSDPNPIPLLQRSIHTSAMTGSQKSLF
jgi:hypothetical protein